MNKFAKYVPEEDKKKQREHIGAVGASDLFVNNKEYVLFDEANIELSSGIPWEGKAHGIPRDDKKYCLICNGIEYDLGSPMKQEGQYGRPMMVFDRPEDCPIEVVFMFVEDYGSTAQLKPVIVCYSNENGVYSIKISEPTNAAEPVFENLVEYYYNYYNDEFRGIHGTDNVTHFCADRMIGGFIYIPLENIPKPDELIGALIFTNVADNIDDYERGIGCVITADMLDLAPTWSIAPGVKYNVRTTDGSYIMSICEGDDTWFGPGFYIIHHVSGIAWGEQTQVKTIDPKYLPEGVGGATTYYVMYDGSNTGAIYIDADYSIPVTIDDIAEMNPSNVFMNPYLGEYDYCYPVTVYRSDAGGFGVEFITVSGGELEIFVALSGDFVQAGPM